MSTRALYRSVGITQPWLDVKKHGARGDGVTDDTEAIQDALDHFGETTQKGGVVYIPRGRYKVSQLVMRNYTSLIGFGSHNFGGTVGVGTQLEQIAGTNDDMIIVEPNPFSDPANPFAGPLTIRGMTLSARPDSVAGCGIKFESPAGVKETPIDQTILEDLTIVRFASHGISLPHGATPIHLRNLHLLNNGGYGIDVQDGVTAFGRILGLWFTNIAGDANMIGLIRVKGARAHAAIAFYGIKSEMRDNYDRLSGVGQPNAIHLEDCAAAVAVHGLQHLATGSLNDKPGDAIKVTGPATPEIAFAGVAIRVAANQVNGADPNVIGDAVDSSRSVPMTRKSGFYGGALELPRLTALERAAFKPAAADYENFPRWTAISLLALTSGQMRMTPIWLPKGAVVNGISFISGSTALALGTNQWAALYDSARNLLAQTIDRVDSAWAAATTKRFAFAIPYVVPADGFYYVGVNITATQPPNLMAMGLSSAGGSAEPPVLGGPSTAGLTGAAPNPAGAITPSGILQYCFVD